ncbi:SRPBCC family protein [Sandaracinus amylolyticus]|uniref:SRPBCC family protein n=1 Tax=Sandaracinus amylolyticus TaxID=927083 RepID=UPI001F1D5153|nr:SRPBCC family protein [Sandaracinus amylolyticus]
MAPRDTLTTETALGEVERVVSTAVGVVVGALGLARGRVSGTVLAALGAYGVYRGVTGRCPVSREISAAARRERVEARGAITIDARPEELYGLWRDLTLLPRFLRHVASVRVAGTRSRWELSPLPGLPARTPRITWDAELVEDVPGRAIAWRTVPGSAIEHAGSVRFERTPDERGTEVQVELVYAMPGAALASHVASWLGLAPEQQLRSDLERLKQLVEVGELGER